MRKIFDPLAIKGMQLKNRLVISAMGTGYFDGNGIVTDRYLAYINERAKGGWGLIITEICRVNAHAGHVKGLPGLYDVSHIESHRKITDCVHAHGGKVAVQLYHGGWRAPSAVTGIRPLAPSRVPATAKSEMPQEMTREDIAKIVDDFSEAALNAKKAGYDGVEIHCGHGYLLSTFLSPTSNKRSDEYGGSLENRARIVVEILERTRDKVGPNFPVWCKLSVHEYLEGGLELSDSQVLARLFEAAGADAIHCSQGTHLSNYATIPPSFTARGTYLPNAAAIKQAVSIPVIAVGRINDPLVAEMALESGQCDLVAMARASLADPALPNKIVDDGDAILRCIGCLQGCIGEFAKGHFIRCLVNPQTGMECDYDLSPVAEPAVVYIAGGGISGCEAAIAAAMRGHKVTLFEATDRLGGQWLAAAVPPGKQEFLTFTAWQKQQLDRLGVSIRLNGELTADIVQRDKPDVMLVASGSRAAMPPIRGIYQPHVVTANDVLLGRVTVGQNVVVIGGGLVGVETADYLAGYGKRVTIVEMLSAVATEAEANSKYFLMQRLEQNHVNIFTDSKVQEIGDTFVSIVKDGRQIQIPADTVVMAAGMRSINELGPKLADCEARVIPIGDANRVKNGLANIQEAFEAGHSIPADAQ